MWKNHDATPTPTGSSQPMWKKDRLRTTSADGAHHVGAASANVTVLPASSM